MNWRSGISEGEREGLVQECAGESPPKRGGILIDRLVDDDKKDEDTNTGIQGQNI